MTAGVTFESGHTDMVHDAQLDYYGRRLATCSSDRTIRVFDIVGDSHQLAAELKGHDGPVWMVAWGHPKYGSILASCSFDHRVIIWKEEQQNQWTKAYVLPSTTHAASINSISWAPYELGLILACGSSDGTVSLLEYNSQSQEWSIQKLPEGHGVGCTAVSWAPAYAPGALVSAQGPQGYVKRLVTAGCDGLIKLWNCVDSTWALEKSITVTSDWIRDVAWAPNMGLPKNTIAVACQDGTVLVYSENEAKQWDRCLVTECKPHPVWRVSWSLTGSILAVSDGSNTASLWKEVADGRWEKVNQ